MSESAAVAMSHPVKGEALYCFVTLKQGVDFSETLVTELRTKGETYFSYKLLFASRPDLAIFITINHLHTRESEV